MHKPSGQPRSLPLRPLQVQQSRWDKPAHVQRAEAAAFEFLKRVVVDGDEAAECSQRTPAVLCGFVVGALELVHQYTGMTEAQARDAVRKLIANQARLNAASVAMLPPEDDDEDDGAREGRCDREGDS